MNIRILIFMYFVTIIALSVNGKKKNIKRKMTKCDKFSQNRTITTNFDTFVFTLSWPAAVCYKHLKRKQKISCKLPKKNQWSIHGLWPSRIARRAPDFCNCSMNFNLTEISPLRPELKEKWSTIVNNSNETTFWNHEWLKHGTCAVSVEALNTQFKYFNQTLRLYDKYNISEILSSAEIKVEGTYNQVMIISAFEKKLGKQIGVNCLAERAIDKYFLSSIHLCFDKTFNLIDCVKNQHYPTNCPRILNDSAKIEYSDMEDMMDEFL